MRTSKILMASSLMVIFSVSARPQASGGKTLGQSPALELQNASSQSRKPASTAAPVAAGPRLLSVRISAEEASSRVVLKTNALVRYSVGRLSNPDRLYVHLLEATVDPQLKVPQIAGQDPLVSGIQIRIEEDSVTRVVLDLKSDSEYHVSELPGGQGLAIELTRKVERASVDANIRATPSEPVSASIGIAPSEEQSLSAAISNPEMSTALAASATQPNPAAIPSEPASHSLT